MEEIKFITSNGVKREVVDAKAREMIESLGGGGGVVVTTYDELKTLRNNGELSAGTWYRITDYECTTKQDKTRSAGHKFDILVLALDENTLSEEARACKHEGEDYFDGCDIEAWKIWYSFENDENRFAWAVDKRHFTFDIKKFYDKAIETGLPEELINYFVLDFQFLHGYCFVSDVTEDGITFYSNEETDAFIPINEKDGEIVLGETGYTMPIDGAVDIKEGGKGVIYRMIDECGNDCPYDFKNIQFYREYMIIEDYEGYFSCGQEGERNIWAYTFSGVISDYEEEEIEENDNVNEDVVFDTSLKVDDIENNVYSVQNTIEPISYENYATYYELNNVVLFGYNANNTIKAGSYGSTFSDIYNVCGRFQDCVIAYTVSCKIGVCVGLYLLGCDNIFISSLGDSSMYECGNITVGSCFCLHLWYCKSVSFANDCSNLDMQFVKDSTFHNGVQSLNISSYDSLYYGNEIAFLEVHGGDYNGVTMDFDSISNNQNVKHVYSKSYDEYYGDNGGED